MNDHPQQKTLDALIFSDDRKSAAKCPCHFDDSFEPRLSSLCKRFVQTGAFNTGFLGNLGHSLGASGRVQGHG